MKMCNGKISKESQIGVAEVSFYNHVYVTLKHKFKEI